MELQRWETHLFTLASIMLLHPQSAQTLNEQTLCPDQAGHRTKEEKNSWCDHTVTTCFPEIVVMAIYLQSESQQDKVK